MTSQQEYSLHIVSKGEASDSIKAYIEKKLEKLERLTNNIIDIHVRVEVQKRDQSVNIIMKFSHFNVQAHAVSHDLYLSIDRAIERLQNKLRKWKTKIQQHHVKKPPMQEMKVNVFSGGEEYLNSINDAIQDYTQDQVENMLAPPEIVKQKARPLKTLTVEEALMKIELSMDNFLVFRSEEDQKLKVVYRRRDQSYGLLQPE